MKTLFGILAAGLAALPAPAAPLSSLAAFQKRAAAFHSEIRVPPFETTPGEIAASAKSAIAAGDAGLDGIAGQDPAKATFESTFVAYDDVTATVGLAGSRLDFIQESNPSGAMRGAAEEGVKAINRWEVGAQYREDVYRVLKAFAAAKPSLGGEDRRLLAYTLRDYRRAGMDLAPSERKAVEDLRKELTGLETDFSTHIIQTRLPLTFTRAELAGVPERFLEQPGVKTGPDAYTIMVNVTPQRLTVEENCSVESTRRTVTTAEFNLAKAVNLPLLNRIVALRNRIALKLGYASWDDYQTEVKMAGNGATATAFVENLIRELQPKFDAEISQLQKLKAAETHDPDARIEIWDWRYYQHELVKERYSIDTEALRIYFPYDRTLHGLFAIYQSLFGLKFEQVAPPYVWAPGVTLWAVSDARTGEPMGLFYLDMFPREGKYNHFAEFGIQPGWLQPDGVFLRPTVALLCNFSPPSNGAPALMDHVEVTTLFHEFGHCMHAILSEAKRARFSGTNVPGDFVEAPSQMLENWTYDKSVLDTFAGDYRDPSRKVPAAILNRMRAVRTATSGVDYRRQLAFALLDLTLHGPRPAGAPVDAQAETNRVLGEVFLPVPPGSAFVSYFGHLAGGYDAGYYGYAWADSIAADMASVFERSKHGFLDRDTGMRLRREIYSRGDSRDIMISIEKFLGRPPSDAAFLKRLGVD